MILYIILGIVILLVLWVIAGYNKLIRLREMVKNAMGQIAANVESRWDALKSLIDATKKYSEHESETLKNVIAQRGGVNSNSTVKDIEADNNMFTQALSRLAVVVENYPELKANTLYLNTMDKIDSYEQDVKNSRMVYNDTVTKFNRTMLVFPLVLISRMMGFTEYEYFKNTETKTNPPSWD
ncbi:LemA family protein [uncultured Parvimonas sp.]|uniref:LemA family protein n=1 Tax=uncultured Parvimonas sp. TaxID=747372 RepID=UPI002593ABAB|nr:LemA family protein [uncultured Parvimonas sp.]